MIDILIVDDDPHIRKLLEETLKAEYTCMTAGNTVQARHRLEEQSFDLVLCDIRMSGESGIDLVRDLTTTSPDIAVIMVSGIDDLQTMQLAIELGIYGYIIKPFNRNQVRVTVSNALKRLELEKKQRDQVCCLKTAVEARTLELERTVANLEKTRYELQQSKEALEKEYQFLNTLIEAIPSPVFCKDLDGHFIICNKAFEAYIGLKKNQIIGKTVHDIFPEDHARKYHQADLELIRKGGTQIYDAAVSWSDGSIHEVVLKKTIFRNASDVIAGLIGILNDRTELISVESKLRDSEAQLKAILDNIQSGVFTIRTHDRVIVDVNRKALQLTGYTQEELIGRACHEFICSHDPGSCPVLDKGLKLDNTAAELKTKTGLLPIIKTTNVVEINGQNHLIDSFADISELRRIEKDLKIREEKYRNIFNNIQDVYYETSVDGTILELSPSIESATGYTRENLIGKTVDVLYVEPKRRDALIERLIETEKVHDYEVILKNKDGRPIHAALSATLVKDQAAQPLKLIGIIRDITERKKNEQKQKQLMADLNETLKKLKNTQAQMLHADKMSSIGQLSAGVAHEINTPIQFVGDNVRFLNDSFSDLKELVTAYKKLNEAAESIETLKSNHKEVQEIAERIDLSYLQDEIPLSIRQTLEGVERIAEIVRAMKDFSHPGSDRKTMLDIHSAINSTLTVARNEWKYVADVETDFDKTLEMVPCFPGDFNQVILNLVINASHAIGDSLGNGTGGKGKIKIQTRKNGSWALISIQDTGTGIPKKIQPRIFDPFFTTKKVGKGTGQGLAIAYSVIVDKHGGSIHVDSVEAEGAKFVIQLPLDDSPLQ